MAQRKNQGSKKRAKKPDSSLPKTNGKPQLVSAKPLTTTRPEHKKPKSDHLPVHADDDTPKRPVTLSRPGIPAVTNGNFKQDTDPPAVRSAPVPQAAAVSSQSIPASTVDTTSARPLRRRHVSPRRRLRRFWLIVAILVGASLLGYYVVQHHQAAAMSANQRLIRDVSRQAVVPTDEIPSVTTVTDPAKVNQQFLEGTKKGDKVLLYYQSSRAVVYRPSTDQVVNMGPFSAPSPRVWLRAGTMLADIPKIGNETNVNGDFVVVSNDVSTHQDYKKTIVIDLAGNRPDIAKRLATQLHAAVGQLPDSENKPDADLLVIIGSDNKR